MTVNWVDLERALCRIPHVTSAHVVPDERDAVIELHVVASPGKHPKQLVRDVQSLAMAAFGVDVDRHVVSVVQLEDELPAPVQVPAADGADEGTQPQEPAEQPADAEPERTLLSQMTLQSQQGSSSVSVVLRRGGREATGSTCRPATAVGLHRMAAEATLEALTQLHPGAATSDVEGVEVRELGSRRVAMVSVAQRTSRSDDVLVGTASVRAAGELDAVARAVLDAVNRCLTARTG